jgi:RND family efflux transporter MFP subunit
MRWWKQVATVAALVLAVVVAWGYYVPAAAPLLASIGLPVRETVPGETRAGGEARRGQGATAVVSSPVGTGEAWGRIAAIGDGRAVRTVAVTPLVSGRIEAVAVRSGQQVVAGDLLVVLDSDSEAIELDRAALGVEDAEATLERVERLQVSGAVTDVQLREAQLSLDRARLEQRDAELAVERRSVRAPISGVVGIVPVEPGVQVGTSTEVATIDDRSRILVDFRVPERWVGQLAAGDPLEATALALPGRALVGEILALDNRVEETTRTLRVQAVIENPDDALRAGMAFRIAMSFRGETYPAVDPLSVQWGSDGAYVWAVRDGKAAQVPVRIVQRSQDTVLVAATLVPGELVVIEGLQRLRPGAEVEIRGAPPAAGSGSDNDAGLGARAAAPVPSET